MLHLLETFTITRTVASTKRKTYTRLRGVFRCSLCSGTVILPLCQAKRQKFCGCKTSNSSTHGLAKKHPLWNVWCGMKQRCSNQNSPSFHNYGGRGISVCLEWATDFAKFYRWALDSGWRPGLELDQRNNNGNYTPINCRFVTDAIQSQNRRTTKLTRDHADEIRARKANGETKAHLSREFNVTQITVSRIIHNLIWK